MGTNEGELYAHLEKRFGAAEARTALSTAGLTTAVAELAVMLTALKAAGAIPHNDRTSTATLAAIPAASSEGTAVTLINGCRTFYLAHAADVAAHLAADETNTIGAASTDEATAITLANDIKAKLNLHILLASSHNGAGAQMALQQVAVSTTDASDAGTLNTLCNALQAALIKHAAMGAASFTAWP